MTLRHTLRHSLLLARGLMIPVALTAALSLPLAGQAEAARKPRIWYVNNSLSTPGNGSSWLSALHDLQSAVKQARDGDEIWIARGTYKPTAGKSREASFRPSPGVALYGGFRGNESQVTQRNWLQNPVVLSGDIGKPDNRSDNSRHVVIADHRVILDGLVIEAGHADGRGQDGKGGGVLVSGDISPVLRDVLFRENSAREGGGLYITRKASPALTSLVFQSNRAEKGGAMVSRSEAETTLARTTMTGNTAEWRGGAILIDQGSKLHLVDARFLSNESRGHGGAIWIDQGVSRPGQTAVRIDVARFESNSARGRGGAIAGFGAVRLDVNRTEFEANSAEHGGGAIAADYGVFLQRNSVSHSSNDGHDGSDNLDEAEAELIELR